MSKFFDTRAGNATKGYHLTNIDKGKYGEFSKIKEEFLEAEDAYHQANPIMTLMELSDLLIVIDAYANKYGMDLNDLISMAEATSRAHKVGEKQHRLDQYNTLGDK